MPSSWRRGLRDPAGDPPGARLPVPADGGVHDGRTATVPAVVRDALQDAMEVAIGNVPQLDGSVVVCPDVSAR